MFKRAAQRGFSIVTFLMLVGVAAGAYWLFAFGPIYYDNFEIRQVLAQAGNMAYTERNDVVLRKWVHDQISQRYQVDVPLEEIILERNDATKVVRIETTYARIVTLPVVGGQRTIYFQPRAEQDISPNKY